MRSVSLYSWLAILVTIGLAAPAVAVDGVIEINQTRATVGSVTVGDAAGFPVTISEPGSYVLTGDLTLPNADATGIVIQSSHVVVDLNGFSIVGPVSCERTGGSIACSGGGAGRGVRGLFSVGGVLLTDVAVRNGTIRGAGEGVRMGRGSTVEKVNAVGNATLGIAASDGWLVVDCVAFHNGGSGIVFGESSIVRGNRSRQNGAAGFDGYENDGSSGVGCLVTGNISTNNDGVGVKVDDACLVRDNIIYGNDGRGLTFTDRLGGRSGYAGNVITSNASAEVSGGNDLGGNVCGTNTTCP